MEYLNNHDVYKPLNDDISNDLKQNITKKLDLLFRNGLMKRNWVDFCQPPNQTRTPRLYFLKKIHKNPMGIRPIVSSCNSITEPISQFVDKWLQNYVHKLPSYLKDSTQFINLIESQTLPHDCFLASIDVSSLYTNIPHSEGVQSVLHFLSSDPDAYKQPEQPIPEVLSELVNIVLKNNVFEFNNRYYLQIQGTAMGTKMAPAYANLFMGKLEQKLIHTGKQHIRIWKRFIDDIFIIWTGSHEQFSDYMTEINQLHDTIKFTHDISDTELTFLDVTLYKGNRFRSQNILDIRTQIKPTNKQLYVHASSYHPPSILAAISKGETHRYLRTNSDANNFEKNDPQPYTQIKTQNQILKHVHEIKFNQRPESLTNRKQKEPKLIFTTNYCDDIRRIKCALKKHWKLIE
jgi:hypothetical protein